MNGYWFNAIQPYVKNGQISRCPSAAALSSLTSPFVKAPNESSMTYNGLLWSSPLAAIQNPVDVPSVWDGQGTTYLRGFVGVNPVLRCPDPTQPCRFVPSAPGCNPGVNGQTSTGFIVSPTAWVHSKWQVWVYVDGHAKWRRMGEGSNNSFRVSVWATYDAAGAPSNPWSDGCHRPLFKPDLDLSKL